MKLKIIKFKKVQSTNDEAIKFLKNKRIKPSLIITLEQTRGRGTMGKKWISQKGNLFFSVFFKIDQTKINFKQFAILNAYLIKNILKKFTRSKINIKWPNDILLNSKKVCGILQEVLKIQEKTFLIVGIGVNTNFSPKIKNYESISLKKKKKKISNRLVLKNIIIAYEKLIGEIEKKSFSELKKNYCF